MECELELSKHNRLRIAAAFRQNERVDYSIDCVIEGQMGRAFADSLDQPRVYCIRIGPFWYFAGDASCASAQAMMAAFPAYHLLMPSPPEWIDLAHVVFGDRLKTFPRYRFTTNRLSHQRVSALVAQSPHRAALAPMDAAIADQLTQMPEAYVDLADFDSVDDFLARGVGFVVKEGDQIKGAAYSSLVCSKGIEVSIYVEEAYRGQGVATALGSRLLLYCLEHGLRPNWDAANPESCRLAEKLGFTAAGTYASYYYAS